MVPHGAKLVSRLDIILPQKGIYFAAVCRGEVSLSQLFLTSSQTNIVRLFGLMHQVDPVA